MVFERKMTQEVIERAKKLFTDLPMLSCKDVAETIEVSESTLRRYLAEECHLATMRQLEQSKTVQEKSKTR